MRAGVGLKTTKNLALFALASLAAARLVSACGGDDDADPAELDGGQPPGPPRPEEDGALPRDDASADAGPLPSFCAGIVFYARLDTSFAPALTDAAAVAYGAARLVPTGRFGGAGSFPVDAGDGDGAAVSYYEGADGGVPWYPETQGTVSLWYRGAALDVVPPGTAVLWRAMESLPADPQPLGGGLALLRLGGDFDLVTSTMTAPVGVLIRLDPTEMRPYTKKNEFNHFVSAWKRGPDAGAPSALVALNGGLGNLFDALPDGSTFQDAAPDEAGAVQTPYLAYRATPWELDASARAFRLGGTGTSAAAGDIDDVVVWDRVLSLAEIGQVYSAGKSVGDACRLP